MTAKKEKLDWSRWIAFLEEASIPESAKVIGRAIPPLMRRTRRAFAPWELPNSPGYHDLSPLVVSGLLYLVPSAGHFVPIIDPLPAPNSIRVTPAMRRIIRILLAGGDLYLTDKGSRYARPGWQLKRDWNGPTIRISQRCLNALHRRGLLEWDGCGNWPVFDHRRYRVDMRMLHGVGGFRAISLRWINKYIARSQVNS